ncbi:hypothetical protein PO124_11960 [Bacillus licheniformis]|nr:hypothetical protein [Bacillus licheniformis]
MSDTQYYSESYPHILNVRSSGSRNKGQAEHSVRLSYGDLVDEADQPLQWKRADQFMKVLDDNQVPYGVLAGNHDVSHKDRSYLKFGRYFGERRFKQNRITAGLIRITKGITTSFPAGQRLYHGVDGVGNRKKKTAVDR